MAVLGFVEGMDELVVEIEDFMIGDVSKEELKG